METTQLIEILKVEQGDQSDAAFAARLGVNRETWRLLKHGQGKPGRKVLSGIMRAFPSLQLAVASSLVSEKVAIATHTASGVAE